jgi:hypothetical protein
VENTSVEILAVAEVVKREVTFAVSELADLELALVGGGMGETILA